VANFRYAQCQGADFWYAQCQGANFWYAQCQGANFHDSLKYFLAFSIFLITSLLIFPSNCKNINSVFSPTLELNSCEIKLEQLNKKQHD
jgi:uncharacterized protein YjbI with pentapeptide repeats